MEEPESCVDEPESFVEEPESLADVVDPESALLVAASAGPLPGEVTLPPHPTEKSTTAASQDRDGGGAEIMGVAARVAIVRPPGAA